MGNFIEVKIQRVIFFQSIILGSLYDAMTQNLNFNIPGLSGLQCDYHFCKQRECLMRP